MLRSPNFVGCNPMSKCRRYKSNRKTRNFEGIELVKSIPTDELKQMRSRVSVAKMAECFSVSSSFMYNHLSRLGIRGVPFGSAKLTEAQVLEIRALQGKQFCSVVARQYQVNRATIQAIWDRLIWAWVEETQDASV